MAAEPMPLGKQFPLGAGPVPGELLRLRCCAAVHPVAVQVQLVEDQAARPAELACLVEAGRHREEHRKKSGDHRDEYPVVPCRMEQLLAAADRLIDRCRALPVAIDEGSDHEPARVLVAGGVRIDNGALEYRAGFSTRPCRKSARPR